MSSYNKVILMGNLTRDPEMRQLPSGNSVCEFGLATNRVFKGQDGEQREEVTFVDIVAWGQQGEVIGKYFTKGKPIMLEGRLKLDQWETPEGEKRSKLRVVLERFTFVGSREDSESAAQSYKQSQPRQSNYDQTSPPPRQQAPAQGANQDIDDDVPF